jgi:hypothetical protein
LLHPASVSDLTGKENEMSRYEKAAIPEELTPEAIQTEVERILASEKFARSKRLRTLLRFTVAQTLQGNADMLKEYVIGTEVLKKPDSYDPRRPAGDRISKREIRSQIPAPGSTAN